MVENFHVGEFILDPAVSPLAFVIASITFSEPIDANANELKATKECFSKAGFSIESRRTQRNVQLGVTTPVVDQYVVYQYLDVDRKRGASISKKSLSYFASDHQGIDDLSSSVGNVFGCFEIGFGQRSIESVGLRYVNVFQLESVPSKLVSNSLTGLAHRGLTTPDQHFHHNYEFWCETDGGRIHTRYAVTHGDRRPEQLGVANSVFPERTLGGYDDNYCHLDIFENTRKIERIIRLPDFDEFLRNMNRRIEQAFLNAVTDKAMTSWGARPRD